MNADEYQKWTNETAIYDKSKGLEYLTLGLCSEAGEVAGKVKKFIRDGLPSDEEVKKMITSEVGDVLWYCAQILQHQGITLSECFEYNKEKLTTRKNNNTLNGSGDHR